MKTRKLILLSLILLASTNLYAQAMTADTVVTMVQQAMKPALENLASTAVAWLGIFATLQFVITNFGVLKSGGDIDQVFAKFIGSVAWIGICFYILTNGPHFIASVGDQFFNIVGTNLPSASDILLDALVLVGKMIVVSMVGAGIPLVGNTLGPLIVYIMIFNFAVSVLFAFKIFMVQVELGLVVMLSPLSFSFLGMNALKNQGIAPFKSLISLGYRIILMTVIMAAYSQVSTVVGDAFEAFGKLSTSDFVSLNVGSTVSALFKTVISAFGAYLMLAYLLFKSDSIAASLAGGSTSMGTADVASAAALGAAAGAAVASGGASLAATNPVQSMSNFMQGLRGGGGGSVSNASSTGTGMGGATSALPLPLSPPPLASMGGSEGKKTSTDFTAPTTPTQSSKPTPDQLSKLSPQAQNGFGVSSAAEAAGANQKVSKAAGDAAYMGGSPQDIEAAVAQAGGTQAQGQAAGSASTGVGGPDWNKAAKPVEAAPSPGSSGSTAALIGSANSPVAAQQGSGYKKTALDHLSNTNNHIAQEKAATHVSIDTHHSD